MKQTDYRHAGAELESGTLLWARRTKRESLGVRKGSPGPRVGLAKTGQRSGRGKRVEAQAAWLPTEGGSRQGGWSGTGWERH